MHNSKQRTLKNRINEMTNFELLSFRRDYNKEREYINQDDRKIIENFMDDREEQLKCED